MVRAITLRQTVSAREVSTEYVVQPPIGLSELIYNGNGGRAKTTFCAYLVRRRNGAGYHLGFNENGLTVLNHRSYRPHKHQAAFSPEQAERMSMSK
jgi:hypothetical protein